jgi:hypothetical protein
VNYRSRPKHRVWISPWTSLQASLLRGEGSAGQRGCEAGYREATGAPWLLEERAIIEPRIDAARSRLEEAVWQEEWEKGRSMTLDQAVGYALEVSEGRAMEQD